MSGDVVAAAAARAVGGGVVPAVLVPVPVLVAEGKECNYTRSFRPFFTEKAIQRMKKKKKTNKGLSPTLPPKTDEKKPMNGRRS